MKITLKYAEKMARYWIKKATELGTSEWFSLDVPDEQSHPQKNRTGGVECKARNSVLRKLKGRRVEIADKIPTLEEALAFAESHQTKIKCTPEIVREWYAECEFSFWCDGDANPIHNWAHHLMKFAYYHAANERQRDPGRIPDVRYGAY